LLVRCKAQFATLRKGSNARTVVLMICILAIGSSILPSFRVNGTLSTTATNSSVASFVQFDGLNQSNSGYVAPPDPQVAAGPNHVVEMVNTQVAVYTKQGAQVRSVTFASFFQTGADHTFDPRVLFDSLSGRWFATLDDGTLGTVRLAVSTTSDPTGAWNVYTANKPKTYCPDQPRLGLSGDKVVITAIQFNYLQPSQPDVACFGANFVGSQYWVLSKADLVSGATNVHNITIGPTKSLAPGLHPVQTLSPSPVAYMIDILFSPPAPASFQIITLSGTPPDKVKNTTLIIGFPSNIQNVPANGSPEPPPFSGGTYYLDTFSEGTHVQSASWSNGVLWFAFNSGCTPAGDNQVRNCIHFDKVNTANLSILQDFDFGARMLYYFYPSLSIDVNGNLDVLYGYSNATTYPSLAMTGQGVNNPPNSLVSSLNVKTGTATWTLSRWGDYFGAGVDPSDPSLVWVVGEYMKQNPQGFWSTLVANMRVVPLYTMSMSPTQLNFICDQTGCDPSLTSTLTIKSANGFSGTVAITYIAPGQSGNTMLTGPPSAIVPAGGSANVTLTASPGGIRGTFIWTIQGSFNGYATSTTLTIVVSVCRPGVC
jgi:hypothetical protein